MAKEKEEKKALTPEEQAGAFLSANKEFHYNDIVGNTAIVSSGSLKLDIEMAGGLRAGISRFGGVTEGGKSSSALAFMSNFLKLKFKVRGVYIKAEGRLSENMKERTGVPFVEDIKDWKDGTCFILKTNVFETAIGFTRNLIQNNPTNTIYFFIYDSMDALCRKEDLEKTFEEANKVAGSALLSSDFLRRMAIAFSSHGHYGILINQRRSTIKINQYAPNEPKITDGTGGNAQLHYSDWIFEFQHRGARADFIWEGEEGKSKKLGHQCSILFKKSPNEKTGQEISYPIKYGKTGGNSVWTEHEIADILKQYGLATKKGTWWEFDKSLLADIKTKLDEELKEFAKSFKKNEEAKEIKDKIVEIKESWDMPIQVQGIDNIPVLFETKPKITKYLSEKLRNLFAPIKQKYEII